MKRFVIYQGTDFGWHWELRLPNGGAIAKSAARFETEAHALEAVRSMRRAGPKAAVVHAMTPEPRRAAMSR